MENKEIKTYYPYYFADGTQSIVTAQDVGQEWIDLLYKMDEEEKNHNRRETRRHISIESLMEINKEPTVMDEYFGSDKDMFGEITDEKLRTVLSQLTEKQRDLLYDVVVAGIPQKEIAERDGQSATAVNNRFMRIIKKFQTFFAENVDF